MSRTLSLIGAGWESIRAAAARGRRADALDKLTRVLARPDVPAELAADAHRLAGELALDLGRYPAARRYLKVAAALDPAHANTRFLIGRAWEEDPSGCDRRAAVGFKKAAALAPANPLYRATLGRAAARCDKVKFGTRQMLAAVLGIAATAECDLNAVRVAVGGLLEAGKTAAARRALAHARFLCPGDAELAGLWERVTFESARRAQRKVAQAAKAAGTNERTRPAQDAHFATDGDRVTLPFLRPVGTERGRPRTGEPGGTVRCDPGSFPRPHFARLRARKADY
jgi:tetratricopeptide (TPR) repeat protein